MMMIRLSVLLLGFLFTTTVVADGVVLPMRERAEVVDQWLDERMETVLPELMERSGIDMWLIIAREYNEDPVIRTMLPSTWQSARRRTILLIYQAAPGEALETLAVARYGVGDTFSKAWDKEEHGEQWQRLAQLIEERDPEKIGVNYSATFAHADGITHTEYQLLNEALPARLRERIVSAEDLAVGWLETRTASEMAVYQNICRIAHEILAEGLTEHVIQPGVTTTRDVVWWYRERIRERKLTAWFHPSVSIQRAAIPDEDFKDAVSSQHLENVIQPGDLLHVDFGITYLRLNTDTQQHAYVLRAGESAVPNELREAFAAGNRLQDILTSNFATGRSGNEILAASLDAARAEGINGSIYTHPIGYHGHAAGPAIGMWDNQGTVSGTGDYQMNPNTAYSIELYAATPIASWGDKEVRIMLEEDAYFDGESVHYIDGRQREIYTIPAQPGRQ